MRATKAHRHAKALAVANGDVSAPLARRREQREREQIGGGDQHAALGVDRVGQRAIVAHVAAHAGVLHEHAERIDIGRGGHRADLHFEAQRLGARLHDFDGLRQHVIGDEERVRLRLAGTLDQRHRLGGGSRFVEHRRVGDRQPRHVDDHLLIVEQRFETALRDFRLIRRIGRVPGRIFQHVAQDHARRERVGVALTDERLEHLVLAGQRAQLRQRLRFGLRGGERAERLGEARAVATDRRGDHGVDQCGTRRVAQLGEHRLLFGGVRADVARGEVVALLQLGERAARRLQVSQSIHGSDLSFDHGK